MSMPPGAGSYTCPYCRIPSDGGGGTCPRCGAPVDIRLRATKSGWAEQPPIRDMARIHFNRSTCQISGAYVPVAEMNLHPEDWVYFSHHVLLHTDPNTRLEALQMGGGWNRVLAGMPMVMMKAQGPGHIAFSADHPGETLAIPLQHNQAVDVVEHRFLVATGNVTYRWERSGIWFTTQNGDEQEWHYPLGQMMDRFTAQGGPGLLLLHGPGNTFIRDLAQGERILVQPSGLIWKDPTVRMHLHIEYPRGQYWFSSARWQAKSLWLTLTGPGRVAVQSVFERPEMVGSIVQSSGATTQYW
ncbi:MAG TPA: AIM24 family protein [Streptosporangiaceae bacterium]|nr:AIM24 family protein [Streptosporangiaceae bacterium]